ncbi:intraflagellar transport protein 57 homolog [Eurytemora carolleeae]|uniref:intraflagellar transport protein 57 homolog n=1 Tax=Eurytemora carolleeae TaxID=1294199 RepID=UPI000C78311E|nr:intraflagellar transport protein 57 homolog [Eurytemora carolleeae]|eukprot:XP_023321011.1 intraflagellar transport protein 57 homolog [Eurytemora affinis]
MRPLNRHYFVLQTNPGEQFFLFTSLSAWLIRKAGKSFDPPQEFDDPNSTISKILENVRKIGVTIDFAPSKLKQGYGEQAIFVLDRLSDEALRFVGFSWNTPIPPVEEGQEEEEIDDDMEVNLDRVEEDMAGDYSEEEEGDILHIDDLSAYPLDKLVGEQGHERPEQIMESSTDAEQWKLEVERVAPQLKVTVRVDARDWRSHLEQMHEYRQGIQDSLVTTRTHLDRLQSDISKTLEKISSREKYLNSQLEGPLGEYKQLSQMLAQTREQYKQVSGGVTERSRLLSQLTDDLDAVKSEMEERGSSMTDGSPLVNIRKSLSRVRSEIVLMDVRIGVVEHTLLQARLKDKSMMQRDLQIAVNQNRTFNSYL